uniref:RING-type domain-containing protein n=1 Tax=Meloidogyne enterolobii TaxID=390850 RepID=A0A6V7TXC4_MELEN|nr:unnamed protein product [Meloidogyne enterolobii]
MSAEESTSLNIKNNETTFDNLQKNSEQKPKKKNRGPAYALKQKIGKKQRLRIKKKNALAAIQAAEENNDGDDVAIEETTTTEVDASSTQEKANDLFDNKNYVSAIKYNKLYNKYLNRKKTSFKYVHCTICKSQLDLENVFLLKNCNHTYHKNCITRWISDESQSCPICHVFNSLDDIKKVFLEEASDSSDDDEFAQTSSNYLTKAVTPPEV